MRFYQFFSLGLVSLSLIGLNWTKPVWISNFSLSPQHQLTPESLADTELSSETKGVFNNNAVGIPFLYSDTPSKTVLGDSTEEKRIEVDLTNQRLYAYEGERLVFNFLISSGKWGRTPTGEFRIWIKLTSTKMSGGSKALGTYYYLPNVPFTMFFYNDQIPKQRGYGIHGAYWHNNFGHPMSHGCINMKPDEARELFYWAQPDLKGKRSVKATEDNPGTRIVIYGVAPWQ